MQEGTELLPFLEGLAPLAARLPAREASAAAQHLQAVATRHKPAPGASMLRHPAECLQTDTTQGLEAFQTQPKLAHMCSAFNFAPALCGSDSISLLPQSCRRRPTDRCAPAA